jgi:hypothetical protein
VTPTASPTPTPTGTGTPSPSPTPTRANRAPEVAPLTIYEILPGIPVEAPVRASDPDGDPLRYSLAYAPSGMSLVVRSPGAVLEWSPLPADVGPHFARVLVSDSGVPALAVTADFLFNVRERSPCVESQCDPARGCKFTPVPLDRPCCALEKEPARRPEAAAPCPAGKALLVGRNLIEGFGELENCARFRVINFGQIGATVRLNFATRCLDVEDPLVFRARMRTATRELFDAPRVIVRMQPGSDGFARRLGLAFPVRGPGPFFEFEGAEAELVVGAVDRHGESVDTTLRLRLTFEELPDLPDLPVVHPPWANTVLQGTSGEVEARQR